MSSTQPTSTGEAYREEKFARLNQRDPIDVMSETATALEQIVRDHSPAVLRRRPFAGKWTANEVMGHLVDSELVYGYRLRLILSEENPSILGTRQDAWVERLRHNEREPAEHVATFRALRGFNLAIWRRLSAEELNRTGLHNERGAETLAVMLRLMAGHDLAHLDQIRRYIEAAQ